MSNQLTEQKDGEEEKEDSDWQREYLMHHNFNMTNQKIILSFHTNFCYYNNYYYYYYHHPHQIFCSNPTDLTFPTKIHPSSLHHLNSHPSRHFGHKQIMMPGGGVILRFNESFSNSSMLPHNCYIICEGRDEILLGNK